MIQNLIFVIIFLKIFFQAYNLSPHVPVDIIKVFFILEFVAENLKVNKKQPKRSLILKYSFAQKTSIILRISTLLKLKLTCSQNTAKTPSQFTHFPASMSLFGSGKAFALHHFLTPRTTLLKMSVYFCISLFLFQR